MTTSAGAILVAGYWDTQTGAPTSAPGTGKYRADDWAAPALIAVDGTDANGYARQAGLVTAQPGDLITQLSPSNSQNYQRWTVTSVTDQGTYVALGVEVAETGSAFVPPGSNQRRLLELLGLMPPEPGEPPPVIDWRSWSPPLDPPTAGGLPEATAQAIADATWSTDPHLCAALQWESYAATLPPSPSVASVSTGAQSVSYQPPMPGGDYGAAMSRAAWHRSLMGDLGAIPLTQAEPALPSAPASPWAGVAASAFYWPVAL